MSQHTTFSDLEWSQQKVSGSIALFRFVLGGMMLFAGLGKATGDPFNARGYLANIDPASPVSGLYGLLATSDVLIDIINVIIPSTQILIGVALIVGGFVRLASFGGAIQMIAFYLGGWSGEVLSLFDSTLIYAAGFMLLIAIGAGRFYGADEKIESLDIISDYTVVKYILG